MSGQGRPEGALRLRTGLTALRIASLEVKETMNDTFEFPFEKLEIWHRAIDLADFILSLLESFPQNKHFRLIGQMEGAVSSIAQNTWPVK